jgi:metallo-beta-lactamase family protein
LQEEEARYANQKGFSKHHPALPLYSQDDAQRALDLFQTVDFHELVDLGDGLQARFYSNAHILGSSCIHISDGDK